MPVSLLSPSVLAEQLKSGSGLILLSVDPEDVFTSAHLAGSRRNPVYEMGFEGRMADLEIGKGEPILLYSAADDSKAPEFAAEKLDRAGFAQVQILQGGVRAWKAARVPFQNDADPPVPPALPAGRLALDRENSVLRWTGRNTANQHYGTITLKSGWIELAGAEVVGGELVIDMQGIVCADIGDAKMAGVLIQHLMDHDFFDAERHPEASVRLTETRHEATETPGRPNYHGTAELNLRGASHPLRFSLVGGSTAPDAFSLQGAVSFDRTQWGVIYGSARFFAHLGMHLVNDLIDLDLRLNFKA